MVENHVTYRRGANDVIRRGIRSYMSKHPGADVHEVYDYLQDKKKYRRHLHIKVSISMAMRSMGFDPKGDITP